MLKDKISNKIDHNIACNMYAINEFNIGTNQLFTGVQGIINGAKSILGQISAIATMIPGEAKYGGLQASVQACMTQFANSNVETEGISITGKITEYAQTIFTIEDSWTATTKELAIKHKEIARTILMDCSTKEDDVELGFTALKNDVAEISVETKEYVKDVKLNRQLKTLEIYKTRIL